MTEDDELEAITGVPRAGRDDNYKTPSVSMAPAMAARYADYKARDRAAALAHKPPPLPKPSSEPAGLQHYYVRASISPTSERDTGFIIEGTFAVSDGTVRVYQGNQLVGSSPFKPGDDVSSGGPPSASCVPRLARRADLRGLVMLSPHAPDRVPLMRGLN